MSREDSDLAALSDDVDDSLRSGRAVRGRRRLVLVSQNHDTVASDHECGIQTLRALEEFLMWRKNVPEQSMIETPIVAEPRILARARAFASLDSVNSMECFNHRSRLMQSVPWLMRGAFRSAVQEALSEIVAGAAAEDEVKATRGWKLLLLLPRMILFRPSRGSTIPRNKLQARVELFHQGSWLELLREGASCAERAHT